MYDVVKQFKIKIKPKSGTDNCLKHYKYVINFAVELQMHI